MSKIKMARMLYTVAGKVINISCAGSIFYETEIEIRATFGPIMSNF